MHHFFANLIAAKFVYNVDAFFLQNLRILCENFINTKISCELKWCKIVCKFDRCKYSVQIPLMQKLFAILINTTFLYKFD